MKSHGESHYYSADGTQPPVEKDHLEGSYIESEEHFEEDIDEDHEFFEDYDQEEAEVSDQDNEAHHSDESSPEFNQIKQLF